jgi:hypothetical protein
VEGPSLRCPECGAEAEKVRAEDGGKIAVLVVMRDGYQLRRDVRPATFYACTACEWCSEDKPQE